MPKSYRVTDIWRCMGSDKGCVAGSDDDCKQAKLCASAGKCTMKEGRCLATGEDCKTLCAEQGRCTIEDDRCVAANNKDCKNSLVCKSQGKCIAKQGLCFKHTPAPDDY